MDREGESTLSSPDPLAGSLNYSTPLPPSPKRKKALADSGGNVRLQDFYMTTPPPLSKYSPSPMKSAARTENVVSPWRIRVTVEADPEGQAGEKVQHMMSPTKRIAERRKTTTVPLKDADESSPVVAKRGRGRPRKSLDKPVKRPGTPSAGKNSRRKTQGDTELQPSQRLTTVGRTPPKKARGRPKKAKEVDENTSLLTVDESLISKDNTIVDERESDTTTSPTKRRKRTNGRKSHSPAHPTSGLEINNRDDKNENPLNGDADSQIYREFDTMLESEEFSMVSMSSVPSAKSYTADLHDQEDTADIKDSDQQSGKNADPPPQPARLVGNAEATNLHKEQNSFGQNDTPSHKASSPSSPPPIGPARLSQSPRSLDLPTGGTPKIDRVVRVGSALQGALIPKRPDELSKEDSRGPQESSHEVKSSSHGDDVFGGFSANTRRELKAGLRLGEELAKRQQQLTSYSAKAQDDVFSTVEKPSKHLQHLQPKSDQDYTLGLPGPQNQVQYPSLFSRQLLSPEESSVGDDEDRMSWKIDTPGRAGSQGKRGSGVENHLKINETYHSGATVAPEIEWQHEREAVSRQIREADSSQVIVIPGDDSAGDVENNHEYEGGEDYGDIWQAEAHSTENSREESPPAPELFTKDQVIKPRRSMLPSPWRRQSEVFSSDQISQEDEMSHEDSSIWQPDAQSTPAVGLLHPKKHEPSEYSALSEFVPRPKSHPRVDPFTENMLTLQRQGVSTKKQISPLVPDSRQLGEIGRQTLEYQSSDESSENGETNKEYNTPIKGRRGAAERVQNQGINRTLSKNMRTPIVVKAKAKAIDTNKILVPPTASSTSWFSRLARFLPAWPTLGYAAPADPPNPPEKHVANAAGQQNPEPPSTPREIFSIYKPFTQHHYRTLYHLYQRAKRDPTCYPFDPYSSCAWMLDVLVFSRGWEKKADEFDLGVVNAWMRYLQEHGVDDGKGNGERTELIDEPELLKRVFSLWVGECARGEIPLWEGGKKGSCEGFENSRRKV
ncbi:hypothetical protein MMC20_002596 [Loxospora ochrophaea]|nr:hypothetical protein [Loxospora ochrophaea]